MPLWLLIFQQTYPISETPMVTPEFIYKAWRNAVKARGGRVEAKWLTPEGRRKFLSHPVVKQLSRYPESMVVPALQRNQKVLEALQDIQEQRRKNSKKLPGTSQTKSRKSAPTRKRTTRSRFLGSNTQITKFSNTFTSTSTPGSRTPPRPTPTMSKTYCPACGQIEEGCPCSG